jgi:alpha-ketoglutarate-dependent taurine dioxygenase
MIILESNQLLGDLPQLLFSNGVVVLRGLSDARSHLMAIAEQFGTVWENSGDHRFAVDQAGKMLRISNTMHDDGKPSGMFGDNDLEWHCDFAHTPGNYHGTLLYNESNGHLADTIFCDTRAAFTDLQRDDQLSLDGVMGMHKVTERAYRRQLSAAEQRLLRIKGFKPEHMEFSTACVHDDATARPMVSHHPVSGDSSLYLGPATYVGSDPLLPQGFYERILVHCEQYKYQQIHTWQPDDIILFDNLITMHRRGPYSGTRILWRMQFNYDKHTVA